MFTVTFPLVPIMIIIIIVSQSVQTYIQQSTLHRKSFIHTYVYSIQHSTRYYIVPSHIYNKLHIEKGNK